MTEELKFISPNQAIEIHIQMGYGPVSPFAIIQWTKRYQLGIRVGGRWKIDEEKFRNFLKNGTYIIE